MSSSANPVLLFTGEEDWDCPLCMEEMDLSDKNFRPCPCGYQVCRFCWHKIREDGNQRCPACRKVYNEEEVEFVPVPQEEINRMRQKKRAIKEKREAAAAAELDMSPAGVALTNEIVNSRRHLCEFRVVQRNLVYVIGISAKIAHEHILKEPEFFGQFGKIIKIVVNKKNFLASSSGSNPPSASAYITFVRKDDAARAIEFVDGSVYDDRVIRATYGTTKYCSYFLRGLTCQNPGCMYLHEPGEEVQSFTKEQLSGGNHNLQSFIVDKSESANLRQFGTIIGTGGGALKPTATSIPLPSQTPIQNAPLPPTQSTTPLAASSSLSRSHNDSPKPFTSAPPGLRAPVAMNVSHEENPPAIQQQKIPERVPLINEISTNSFFDRISKMVTSSELEEFASMAPRGLNFFAPKSPPPPPALASLFNFSPLDTNILSTSRRQSPTHALVDTNFIPEASNFSSNSSCPSRQSYSFANLPIRSPKPPSASVSPVHSLASSASLSSNGPLNHAAPAPIKAVAVESLFPSDYRPTIVTNNSESHTQTDANKRFYSTSKPVSSAFTAPKSSSSSQSSHESTNNNSSANLQPSSPALKITIAGKPIDSNSPPVVSPTTAQKRTPQSTDSATFTNRNLFDLLQNGSAASFESETVAMPIQNSIKKEAPSPSIGPVKVVSANAVQPQTIADLEKMARENKLANHVSGLEESMFRTRLEAESLEDKLKMLFEASAQAKHRPSATSIKK